MAMFNGVEKKKSVPPYMNYLMSRSSAMLATSLTQPLDLIKTRMQLSGTLGIPEYKTSWHALSRVSKGEGMISLYKGLGAGLLRQATYSTANMGLYQMQVNWYRKSFDTDPSLVGCMAMSIVAGGFGAVFGNPADVAMVRMMADNSLPSSERRNYKNVGDALMRIVRDEGVLTLWRGCLPTVARAMIVNMVQLASYSQLKQQFSGHLDEGWTLQFSAAMVAGLLSTAASLPLDLAKTRLQQMRLIEGKPEYDCTIDVLKKVVKHEGFLAMWKGFTPHLCRMVPHTLLSFVFLEQMNKAYAKHVIGQSSSGDSA